MRVTKLKSTKRGDRVSVFIDKEFAFSINRNLVADFALFEGRELKKKDIDKIRDKDFELKYLGKVLNLISRRPRSESEVNQYLKEKLYGEKNSDKFVCSIIKKLKEKDYLNDSKFADWWVENRMRFKPRGRYLIKRELKIKGITNSIIEKSLRCKGFSQSKELRFAKELGRKKQRMLKNLKEDKNKKKFLDFLVRKGFSFDISMTVLKELSSSN
jgi:regulatory protein